MTSVSRKKSEIILHLFLFHSLVFTGEIPGLLAPTLLSSFRPHRFPSYQKHRNPSSPLKAGTQAGLGRKRASFLGIKEVLGDLLRMNLLMCERKSSTHFLNRWSTCNPPNKGFIAGPRHHGTICHTRNPVLFPIKTTALHRLCPCTFLENYDCLGGTRHLLGSKSKSLFKRLQTRDLTWGRPSVETQVERLPKWYQGTS